MLFLTSVRRDWSISLKYTLVGAGVIRTSLVKSRWESSIEIRGVQKFVPNDFNYYEIVEDIPFLFRSRICIPCVGTRIEFIFDRVRID